MSKISLRELSHVSWVNLR